MKEIIYAALEFVKRVFADKLDGCDYQHAERVYRKAIYLAKEEKANNFVVALASILHGVDRKEDRIRGICPKVREFFSTQQVDERLVEWVCEIVCNLDPENKKNNRLRTIEAKVVSDANQLDSIGAVGIARCFAYGGFHRINMYDGNIANNNMIKVFYDRLLLVKESMATVTGRELAVRRHEFMERFLQEFYYEWNV